MKEHHGAIFPVPAWAILVIALLTTITPQSGAAQAIFDSKATDQSDACHPEVTTTKPASGIWQNYIALHGRCDTMEAQLYYEPTSNELRFEIAPESIADQKRPPMEIRNTLLRALLSHLFAAHGRQPIYSFATNAYPEIQERIAADAAASSQWNRITGRPRSHVTSASFVRALLNQKRSYRELAAIFNHYDYKVRVASVEQISILRFNEMSPAERALIHRPINENNKLPTGAAIFYRIESR